MELAPRLRTAQYWWLATELVRRHPHLKLVETYPLGGLYDCLTLRSQAAINEVHIDFNRLGGVHVHPDHTSLLTDARVASYEDAHRAVREIEDAAGLVPGSQAPPSTGRVLALRLISQALNHLTNDKSSWDARRIDHDTMGLQKLGPPPRGPFEAHPLSGVFETADDLEALQRSLPPSPPGGEGCWALLRDGRSVALFDLRGYVYTREARLALQPLYSRMNRSLSRVMTYALGDLLP